MTIETLTPEEAAGRIPDGATIAIAAAGGGLLEPEAVCAAVEARFLASGHPRDLTIVNSLGFGDPGHTKGINHFAHEGLVKRVIMGLWSWSPRLQDMVEADAVEAYCLPGGVISQLLREIGAGRPGLFTPVGLGTFVDPRLGGGRCNRRTQQELVELLEIDGREILRYKPFPVDLGIIRGSFADPDGNISAVEEPADLDSLAVALAAHNSGGMVIAQVRELAKTHSFRPREVCVPGVLVDMVTPDPTQMQTHRAAYEPALCGQERTDNPLALTNAAPQAGPRQVIARRAAAELRPGAVVNFGYGIPGGIFNMLAERGEEDRYWLTIEQGIHNGAVIDGALFGTAVNPDAIVSSVNQFDFYGGGGIDVTCLGMGEMDAAGNVNVSHLNGRLVGTGGFIDISQNARKVVFCGTFDTKGSEVALQNGGLKVARPGRIQKLVERVAQITFSADQARIRGQEVVYVTERAVFRLFPEGVALVEVAKGVDLERDVLGAMGFAPLMPAHPKLMAAEYFAT